MRIENKGYHCWVTNITKLNIMIGDLRIAIPPLSTIDLLDYKHSNFSVEQVAMSINKGSLHTRLNQKKILIRESAPKETQRRIDISKTSFPFKNTIGIKAEEKKYKEIEQDFEDDEAFARDNMEAAIEEHKPKAE